MVKIGTFRNWKSFPLAEFKWGLFMPCLIYKEQNENLNFIPTWLFPSNFKQITQENWDEISCWNSNLHFQRSIKENLCFFRRSSFWVIDRRVLEIFFFWVANRGCNWSKTLTVAVILVQVWISTSVHEMFTSDRVQRWANTVFWTEYEYEYYSESEFWPNTNTNNIRFFRMSEYEYE